MSNKAGKSDKPTNSVLIKTNLVPGNDLSSVPIGGKIEASGVVLANLPVKLAVVVLVLVLVVVVLCGPSNNVLFKVFVVMVVFVGCG